MKQNVPEVKTRDMYWSFIGEVAQVNRECGEVRRVQPADASFPEGEEINFWFLFSGCARFRSVQVDAESREDKEEIDSGKREVNNVSRDLRQPRFPPAHCGARRDPERMIRHHGQRRPSTHRVERQHAPDFDIFLWETAHYAKCHVSRNLCSTRHATTTFIQRPPSSKANFWLPLRTVCLAERC